MKIKKEKTEIYAIAIATGTSSNGNKYANVLVSKEAILRTRSNYSLYLDPADKILLKQIGDPDLTYSEDGTRKVTPLEKPMKLEGEYTLVNAEHAPYKVNDRVIRNAYAVANANEDADKLITDAVQRGFDRAEAFYRNTAFYDDYRKFVLFECTQEELEQLLNSAEDTDE